MSPEETLQLLDIWQENTDLLPGDFSIVNDSVGNKWKGEPEFDVKESQFIDRKVAKQKQELTKKMLRKEKKDKAAKNKSKIDPDIPLKYVPLCMKAAMRFAIAKHLENPKKDSDDSDCSSFDSDDYKMKKKLIFESVPYKGQKFLDDDVSVNSVEMADTIETEKTVLLDHTQQTTKLIPEPSRLFFRNTDDTKLFTNLYMKGMKNIYIKNLTNLKQACSRLLKHQKDSIMAQ